LQAYPNFMSTTPTPPSGEADREIVLKRTYDAPRDLVFRMFTEPEHIVQWWGPTGFRDTLLEMDVRPGGKWRHILHGPDGVDYPNDAVYLEVVRPIRLVFEHTAGPGHRTTVTLSEDGGKTTVVMRMVFPTVEVFEMVVRVHGAIERGAQTMGRLAGLLSKVQG
jgi:uncharacterized protein YndB with AHSA1/START domain